MASRDPKVGRQGDESGDPTTSVATSSQNGPDKGLPTVSTAFRGIFHHALDEKGRVSLPVEFRSSLVKNGESTVVITNFISDGARCLEGYSLNAWKRFEAKLASRSRFDPQVRKLENYYLARAANCSLDGSGRISISLPLRQYAGLERDIVFTSSIYGFRIWDKRVWELVFQEAEASLLEDPALFMDVDK